MLVIDKEEKRKAIIHDNHIHLEGQLRIPKVDVNNEIKHFL